MIFNLAGHNLTLVTKSVASVDPLGESVYTESHQTGISGRLEQRGSREQDAYVVDAWQAFLPLSVKVSAGDELIESGRRFLVEGTPAINKIPGFPGLDHQELQLKYVGEVN